MPINLNEANLTLTEAARWQHFGSMTNAQAMSIVEIGDIPSTIFSGGSLSFSIPGVATNLQAIGQFTQQSPSGDYIFWANLTDGRGCIGVASNSAGKFAYAQVDGQHYMMYLLSNRYNALIKLTVNPNFIPQECLPEMEIPSNLTVNEDCEIDNDCPAVVSILVLLTPEALNWLGGNYGPLESALYVTLGLHSVNFALINSGVYNKSVRFIIEPYNFGFSGGPFIGSDLALLSSDAVANSLRNTKRADLMFLLADSRYYPLLGAVLDPGVGVRYLGIVSMEYLFAPYYSFAHEVGHTFYLNHNRVSNNGDQPYTGNEFCAFGWRFPVSEGSYRKTIMAVLTEEDLEPGSGRLLNYSNPNISVLGSPTGTPINFNARHASHNICSVDDYFTDDELRVYISGPLFLCEESATYTANITLPGPGVQGVGPYTIQWRVNDSPFFSLTNPGSPVGSTNPISFYSGTMPHPAFWLYVSVSSTDGVTVNNVIKVDNPCGTPIPFLSGTSGIPDLNSTTTTSRGLVLSPNPTDQHLQVQFLHQSGNFAGTYSIMNSLGEIVDDEEVKLDEQNKFEIDLRAKGLSAGVYFLYFHTEGFTKIQKFILLF